ncbi:hypothetical protein PV10_06534 [Exophiala mesophila]|uniref:Uncharacterized protein n=1 Tax=Exophiala mesophila TaxID=212818 RepID=A0A0D1ZBK0_EXOME|nr:uncharacterized protein PV10_06534 [Exophiala mesophila]KIV92062.1 hypothetical protein PV10_06534 [Exophiala mesophila]
MDNQKDTKPDSHYKIVKDGWGSRTNFQYSHGLKMDPEGLEEGKAILNAYQKLDAMEKADKGPENRRK